MISILVVGDKCTDKYVYGECKRLSPEQPVPVLDQTRIEEKPGMAANTELNLKSFGVNTLLLSQREEIVDISLCVWMKLQRWVELQMPN